MPGYGLPQGSCISPILFNFFVSTFPQSDNLLTNSYADNSTVSCSNSNVNQMAEALTAQSARFGHFYFKITLSSLYIISW